MKFVPAPLDRERSFVAKGTTIILFVERGDARVELRARVDEVRDSRDESTIVGHFISKDVMLGIRYGDPVCCKTHHVHYVIRDSRIPNPPDGADVG